MTVEDQLHIIKDLECPAREIQMNPDMKDTDMARDPESGTGPHAMLVTDMPPATVVGMNPHCLEGVRDSEAQDIRGDTVPEVHPVCPTKGVANAINLLEEEMSGREGQAQAQEDRKSAVLTGMAVRRLELGVLQMG